MSEKDDDMDLDFDDDDLDFGEDMDFGDMGDDIDMSGGSREPAGIVDETGRSFVDTFTDDKLGTAVDLARSSIPKSLSKETDVVLNSANSIGEELSTQKNVVLREARKTLRTFKRVLPDTGIAATLLDKASSLIGEDDESASSGPSGPTTSEKATMQMISMLGEKQDADSMEATVREQLATMRANSLKNIQASTATNIERMRKYMFEVEDKYYRSSLDINLRQLYNLEELVDITKSGFDIFKSSLEAIVKNTGLPDVVKITTSEVAKHKAKQKLLETAGSALFNGTGVIDKLTGKATDSIKRLSNVATDTMANALGYADQASSLSEGGGSPGQMVGMLMAETLKDAVGNMFGKLIGKSGDGQKGIRATKNAIADPLTLFKKLAKQPGPLGNVASMLVSAAGTDTVGFSVDKLDPNAAAFFDIRTKDSINKVIPNLLGKIYSEVRTSREISIAELKRSGGELPQGLESVESKELIYDSSKESLVTRDIAKSDIKSRTRKTIASNVSIPADNLIREVLKGTKDKYTNRDIANLKQVLIKSIFETGEQSEEIFQNKYFKNLLKATDPKLASKFNTQYKKLIKRMGTEDGLQDSLTNMVKSIRMASMSHQKEVNNAVDSGNANLVEELGFVKREKDGSLTSDRAGILDDILSNVATLGTSEGLDSDKSNKKLSIKDRIKKAGIGDDKKAIAKARKDRLYNTLAYQESLVGNNVLKSDATLAKEKEDKYQEGGYTKDGKDNEVAGVVHRNEFVIPKKMLSSVMKSVGAGDDESIVDVAKRIAKDVSGQSELYSKYSKKLGDKIDHVKSTDKKPNKLSSVIDTISNKLSEIANINKHTSDVTEDVGKLTRDTIKNSISSLGSTIGSAVTSATKSAAEFIGNLDISVIAKNVGEQATKVKSSTINAAKYIKNNDIDTIKSDTIRFGNQAIKEIKDSDRYKSVKGKLEGNKTYQTTKNKTNNILDTVGSNELYKEAKVQTNKAVNYITDTDGNVIVDDVKTNVKKIGNKIAKTETYKSAKDRTNKAVESIEGTDTYKATKAKVITGKKKVTSSNWYAKVSSGAETFKRDILDKNTYIKGIEKTKLKLKPSYVNAKIAILAKGILDKGHKSPEVISLLENISNVLDGGGAFGSTKNKIIARQYAAAISKLIKKHPGIDKEHDLVELIDIVTPGTLNIAASSTIDRSKKIISDSIDSVKSKINTPFMPKDSSFVNNNAELSAKSKKYGKESKWDGDNYVSVWDDLNDDEQEALRLEFFSSDEYKARLITSFPLWLRDLKHIDPGTIGSRKGVISDKIRELKSRITGPFNKLKEELTQELFDRLSGKALKELTLEQEKNMKYTFYESKEHKEGLATNFDEWLATYGYRRNGTGVLGRIKKSLSIKNILKTTRRLDRKIVGGLYKGLGKGIIKAPGFLVKKTAGLVKGGATAGYYGGKHLFNAARGVGNAGNTIGQTIHKASLLGTIAGLPFKIAGKAAKFGGGLVKDMVVDTATSIPGLGILNKDKRPSTIVKGKQTVDSAKDKVNKLLEYFKTRDAKQSKVASIKAKVEAKIRKHKKFAAMFEDENEIDGKKKISKIGKILGKAKSLVTPLTAVLAIAGLMKVTGVTMEDIKSGIHTTIDVIKNVGHGISTVWDILKSGVGYTKEILSYFKQLPERIGLMISKHMPSIAGGISDEEYNRRIATLDSTETSDIGDTTSKYKVVVNPDGTTTEVPIEATGNTNSSHSSLIADTLEVGAGAYLARKGYNGYQRTKRVIKGATKIAKGAGKVTIAAAKAVSKVPGAGSAIDATKKVATKMTPLKKGIVSKLMSFLGKIKSKIIKKVGGKAAVKLIAKLAMRGVPFVGAALLAYDAGKTIYNMAHGDSFESAASKAILGIDLFEDDTDDIKLKPVNNVIHAENRFGNNSITENNNKPSTNNKIKAHIDSILNAGTDGETTPTETPSKDSYASTGVIPVDNTPVVSGNMDSINKPSNVDVSGLNPQVAKNLLGMAAEYKAKTGKELPVNSAYRSYAYQKALRDKLGSKAARPGYSTHEFGLAADINTDAANKLEELGLMRKYGFTRPIGGETWHIEPAVVQTDVNRAKKDPEFATAAARASLYRGGGGQGLESGVRKYSRNKKLQIDLLNASEKEVKNNVVDIATKRTNISKPQHKVDLPEDTSTPSDNTHTQPKVDLPTGTDMETPPAPLEANSNKINTSKPLSSIDTITHDVNVTTTVNLEDSASIIKMADLTAKSVDIQSQMLNILGDISGKMDRNLDMSQQPDSNVSPIRSISEPLPEPVINLKRRASF